MSCHNSIEGESQQITMEDSNYVVMDIDSTETSIPEDGIEIYITIDPVILRKAPDTSADVLETLDSNTLLVTKTDHNNDWWQVQKARNSGYVKSGNLKSLSKLSHEEQAVLLLRKFDKILMIANQDLNSKQQPQFVNAEFEYAELVTRLLPAYICESKNKVVLDSFLILKDKVFTGAEYSAVALSFMFMKCPDYMVSLYNNSKNQEAFVEDLYGLEWYAKSYLDTNSYKYNVISRFYQDNVKR